MKTLATNIKLKLHAGPVINCDLCLGLYSSSHRPTLLLTGQPAYPEESLDPAFTQTPSLQETVTIAIATTNPPPGYLTGFPSHAFCFKTWSENEGLLEQLLPLFSPSGNPLFIRALSREDRPVSLTLGFCKAPVYLLANEALDAFNLLLKEFHNAT